MRPTLIPSLGFLLLLCVCDLVSGLGCGPGLEPVYSFLCDLDAVWGVVVEAVAAAGIVTALVLLVLLLILIPRVSDPRKRSILPVQVIFLIGTFGVFGLTFAFIIQMDQRTCPTRVFLWGVLFALCFSCLLAHAWRVFRLACWGTGSSHWCSLGLVTAATLVQVIIAIVWLVVTMERAVGGRCAYSQREFVMLLIYVMCLMLATFALSAATLCGRYPKWRKHGAHIFMTLLLSIAIWVVWIVMLVKGNPELGKHPLWDDPTLAIALVANGWVFLFLYVFPELLHLTCPAKAGDVRGDTPRCENPKLNGVDNHTFAMEQPKPEPAAYRNHFGLQNPTSMYSSNIPRSENAPPTDFTIPRPQTLPSY